MNKKSLRVLRNKLLKKYLLVVPIICLMGAIVLYIFDNVLNGIIVDLFTVLFIDENPFDKFHQLFAIILPMIIAIAALLLAYFLCRELSRYFRIIISGMDDILFKKRDKLRFPDEIKEVENVILEVSDKREAYEQLIKDDDIRNKDLIYLLAQDIKLPLSNIVMYFNLIEKYPSFNDDEKSFLLVDTLDRLYELEDMMNEFFDTTRFQLKYAKMNSDLFYLDRMIEQVLMEYMSDFEAKNIKIKLDCEKGLMMYGDNVKMARVIRDLLKNLLALGKNGSELSLNLYQYQDYYDIIFSIESEHFSAEELAHFFQSYYRIKNGDYKGHVLGLNVAKSIVDMHHGLIQGESFDSELRFLIHIPINVEEVEKTNEVKG